MTAATPLDHDACYRAVLARDARFDGRFFVAVRTTGIYCRPSCPTPTHPKSSNVEFVRSAAAAQEQGYRACKRCRPDAAPGSPDWNVRGDLTARAVRLIRDGVVERDGVAGLARRLNVSERHLHRLLVADLGAGALALSRAQRASSARVLIESTRMPFGDIAFAAGFESIRQFNDTIQAVYALTPTELRRSARATDAPDLRSHPDRDGPATTVPRRNRPAGCSDFAVEMVLRLAYRRPCDLDATLAFLAARAVPGVETGGPGWYARTLQLPHGPAIVHLLATDDHVRLTVRLASLTDLTPAVSRVRALLDLDADPGSVEAALRRDHALAPLVDRFPGRRSPGAAAPEEIPLRAVVGQQISLAGARTLLARLVRAFGEPLPTQLADEALNRLFPASDRLAGLSEQELREAGAAMPSSRVKTLIDVAAGLAGGELVCGPEADRGELRAALLATRGVGSWTADYVVMRATSDPDVVLAGDLVVRRAADAAGLPCDPVRLAALAAAWAPYRSYATHLLWAAAPTQASRPPSTPRTEP